MEGDVLDTEEFEILYGRDHDALRVFISSHMKTGLDDERVASAEAIDSVSGHRAWWWEQDAPMGVLHSLNERRHDRLILELQAEIAKLQWIVENPCKKPPSDRRPKPLKKPGAPIEAGLKKRPLAIDFLNTWKSRPPMLSIGTKPKSVTSTATSTESVLDE